MCCRLMCGTNEKAPVGWYRFLSPPGLRAMTISSARGKVQAWADGKPLTGKGKFIVPQPWPSR